MRKNNLFALFFSLGLLSHANFSFGNSNFEDDFKVEDLFAEVDKTEEFRTRIQKFRKEVELLSQYHQKVKANLEKHLGQSDEEIADNYFSQIMESYAKQMRYDWSSKKYINFYSDAIQLRSENFPVFRESNVHPKVIVFRDGNPSFETAADLLRQYSNQAKSAVCLGYIKTLKQDNQNLIDQHKKVLEMKNDIESQTGFVDGIKNAMDPEKLKGQWARLGSYLGSFFVAAPSSWSISSWFSGSGKTAETKEVSTLIEAAASDYKLDLSSCAVRTAIYDDYAFLANTWAVFAKTWCYAQAAVKLKESAAASVVAANEKHDSENQAKAKNMAECAKRAVAQCKASYPFKTWKDEELFAQLKAAATSRAAIAKNGEVKVNNDGTEIKVVMQKLISQYKDGTITGMIEAVKNYNPIKAQEDKALPAGANTGTLELSSN